MVTLSRTRCIQVAARKRHATGKHGLNPSRTNPNCIKCLTNEASKVSIPSNLHCFPPLLNVICPFSPEVLKCIITINMICFSFCFPRTPVHRMYGLFRDGLSRTGTVRVWRWWKLIHVIWHRFFKRRQLELIVPQNSRLLGDRAPSKPNTQSLTHSPTRPHIISAHIHIQHSWPVNYLCHILLMPYCWPLRRFVRQQ